MGKEMQGVTHLMHHCYNFFSFFFLFLWDCVSMFLWGFLCSLWGVCGILFLSLFFVGFFLQLTSSRGISSHVGFF